MPAFARRAYMLDISRDRVPTMDTLDWLVRVLAAAGFNVAKYVPFGPIREAVPYLLRRAEENTSVAGQSSRELAMLRTELSRRRALGRG